MRPDIHLLHLVLLPVDFHDAVIGVMEINNYTIAED